MRMEFGGQTHGQVGELTIPYIDLVRCPANRKPDLGVLTGITDCSISVWLSDIGMHHCKIGVVYPVPSAL